MRQDVNTHIHTSLFARPAPLPFIITAQSAAFISFEVHNVTDNAHSPVVNATWTFSLASGQRMFGFCVDAVALAPQPPPPVIMAITMAMYFTPRSLYMLFDDGAAQMMNNPQMFFGSNSSWHRFYSLGGGGSVDVLLKSDAIPLSVFIAGNWDGRNSGVQLVLAGDFQPLEDWTDGWENANNVSMPAAGTAWHAALEIAVNNHNFPVSRVSAGVQMDVNDLAAVLTGSYASPAGALLSHYYAPEGRIGPCIATPGVCYANTYLYASMVTLRAR